MLRKKGLILSAGLVSIPPTPSLAFSGTDQERRGFEYFCWETEAEIGHALNLDLAHKFILQSSHSNNAVRSAIIALGSLAEHLQVNSNLPFHKQQASSRCHGFAQAQYGQALKQLRAQIANDPRHSESLAIVSCFLFTLFEFLQGNDTLSMVHIRSGLNMIRHQDGPLNLLRLELLHIFSTMEIQTTQWIGFKSSQAPKIDPAALGPRLVEVEKFFNIEDAAIAMTFLTTKLYHFRRVVINAAGRLDSPDILASKRDLGMQLEWWPLALDRLLVDLDTGLSVEMLHRTFVMRMNHAMARIAFGACLHEDEERVFRAHLPDFRSIIWLAKTVIRPTSDLIQSRVQRIVAANNAGINPVAVFSFYAGVIEPLYMTAIQCTDPKVCREAIHLLSSPPWREGAWDSAQMARMAERKVRQLEKRAILAMALI